MKIINVTAAETDLVFDLYAKAIDFQKTVFDKQWLGFDRGMVEREIAEGRLWKIMDEDRAACIFSVGYEDPVIWGEGSHISAMYIHRIVTDPEFRGRGYVGKIVDWALCHASAFGLRFIRMDTWADNLKLKQYYTGHGFTWKGTVTPAESPTLPAHYRGIELGLFELDLAATSAAGA